MMKARKKNWKLIFKGKIEDFDNSDSAYWSTKTTSDKFKEVKSLCDQYMKIKGIKYSDVSRLLRSTAVLKRQ